MSRVPALLLTLLVWLLVSPPLASAGVVGSPTSWRQVPPVPFDTVGLRRIEGVRVRAFYDEGDSAQAARYVRLLDGQRPLPALPDSVPSGVRVLLAPSAEAFAEAIGGVLPEWVGGVALPSARTLVIPVYEGSLTRPGETDRVLRHEWAHIGLGQASGGLRAPRWFSEGYAEWAGGWDVAEAWQLRVALALGDTPALDSLSFRWPAEAGRARLAYLLSASVIEYLVSQSGVRGIQFLVERWSRTESFEGALRATYGISTGQLEEDWAAFVRQRYGWLNVLSRSAVFWSVLSLGLIAIWGIRRRESRRRMAELRAKDPPDRPAFWLDPEEPEGGSEHEVGPLEGS